MFSSGRLACLPVPLYSRAIFLQEPAQRQPKPNHHQRIAITFIIISSPIARIHNGRGKCSVHFIFDQTGFFQVSADGISFQVNGGSNVMGGKMVGPTELNPLIIGGLSHPDELSLDERSCLPESNMP